MKKRINLSEIAVRMKTIRCEKKLSVREMASLLGIGPNDYRKYERAMYLPPVHIQVLLAQKFNISLDWLILNEGTMYRREEQTVVPQDAMIITSPEIKDIIRFMEDDPLHKFQLLAHFYNYKKEVQKEKDNN